MINFFMVPTVEDEFESENETNLYKTEKDLKLTNECYDEIEKSKGTYKTIEIRNLRVKVLKNKKVKKSRDLTQEEKNYIKKKVYKYDKEKRDIYNNMYTTQGLSVTNIPCTFDPFNEISGLEKITLKDIGTIKTKKVNKKPQKSIEYKNKISEMLASIGLLPDSEMRYVLGKLPHKNPNYLKEHYDVDEDGEMIFLGEFDEDKYLFEDAYILTEFNQDRNVRYSKKYKKVGFGIPEGTIYNMEGNPVTPTKNLPIYEFVECKSKALRKQGETVLFGARDMKSTDIDESKQKSCTIGSNLSDSSNIINQQHFYYGKAGNLVLPEAKEALNFLVTGLAQYGFIYKDKDSEEYKSYNEKFDKYKINMLAGIYDIDKNLKEKDQKVLERLRRECTYSERDLLDKRFTHFNIKGKLDSKKEIVIKVKSIYYTNGYEREIEKYEHIAFGEFIREYNIKIENILKLYPDLSDGSRRAIESCKMSNIVTDEWFINTRKTLRKPHRLNYKQIGCILADIDFDDTLRGGFNLKTFLGMLRDIDYITVANQPTILENGKVINNKKKNHNTLSFPLHKLYSRKEATEIMNLLKIINVSDPNFKNTIGKNFLNVIDYRVSEHKGRLTILEALKDETHPLTRLIRSVVEYYKGILEINLPTVTFNEVIKCGQVIFEQLSIQSRDLREKTGEKFHGIRFDEFRFTHDFYSNELYPGHTMHGDYNKIYQELVLKGCKEKLDMTPSLFLRLKENIKIESYTPNKDEEIDETKLEQFGLTRSQLYTASGERKMAINSVPKSNLGAIEFILDMYDIHKRTLSLESYSRKIEIIDKRRTTLMALVGGAARNFNVTISENDIVKYFMNQIKVGNIYIKNLDNKYTDSTIEKIIRDEYRRGREYISLKGYSIYTGYNIVQSWFGGWRKSYNSIKGLLEKAVNLQTITSKSKKVLRKYKKLTNVIKDYYDNEYKKEELNKKFENVLFEILCKEKLEKINNHKKYTEDEKVLFKKIIFDGFNLILNFNLNVIKRKKMKIDEVRTNIKLKEFYNKKTDITVPIKVSNFKKKFDVVNTLGRVFNVFTSDYNYNSDLAVAS